MKTIKKILEWIDDEIESENDTLEEDRSDSSHMRTSALASRDTLIRLSDFIKEEE